MNQKILSVIEQHLKACVDGIEGPVDPNRTFAEYGANSLDIVEIVSGAMRELKIKIPRTELAGIENIAGLVATFERFQAPANV
jgi:acyl carrier protein